MTQHHVDLIPILQGSAPHAHSMLALMPGLDGKSAFADPHAWTSLNSTTFTCSGITNHGLPF